MQVPLVPLAVVQLRLLGHQIGPQRLDLTAEFGQFGGGARILLLAALSAAVDIAVASAYNIERSLKVI